MRTVALLRNDLRFQLRHGFYAAYLFVSVSYVVLLRALPESLRTIATPPLLLTEASVIGFFFAGALLHLERSDGVLAALSVTPVRTGEYLVSRAVSLGLLTSLACVAIARGGLETVRPLLLAAAGALTAVLFVGLGVAIAARFASLDRFVVWGGLGSAVFGLPMLPYFGLLHSPLWAVVPTTSSLRLLAAGIRGDAGGLAGGPSLWVAGAILLAWCALAMTLAHRWLVRYGLQRAPSRG